MIYEYPDRDAPIRQGDIFFNVPRIEFSLEKMVIAEEHGEEVTRWQDRIPTSEPFDIIVSARPVTAIVATQDCDAIRSRDITLCEISRFRAIERKSEQTTSPKKLVGLITQHARINQKWFYLPPDPKIGFHDKMAVDFLVTLRVPREDLETILDQRKGRLNGVADEHFRERISEFFRRYPYDEWYPLDPNELSEYRKQYPDIQPFPWQSDAE
ncbi:MAG: hypothetical protein KC964_15130 [Candidatus Omnitrophica bacterium]|nr:hypothetical protein [Candidatus Omnitrophota bacterium]